HSIWRSHRQRIGESDEFRRKQGKRWEDLITVKDPEVVISNFLAQYRRLKSSDAKTNACRTAIRMLFRIQGFLEKEINGFVLNEQEHMGCVISSIMAFATLRLTEIHRAKATRNEDGSWQLDTAVWKGDDYDLTVAFRTVSNKQICPTT
ncbi:MAG: hypothetical protein EZS28_042723, partial [Streblomastix strix]